MSKQTIQSTDFQATLEQLQGGRTLVELNEAITNLAMMVMQTGKGGELNLKIKLKPKGVHKIIVTDTITSKIPAFERLPTIFYAKEDGVISRATESDVEPFERDEEETPQKFKLAAGG